MHDQVLVGVLHRGAHSAEQGQLLGDGKIALPAIAVDGNAVYQLHYKVRGVLFGAAIDQPCDVGVVEIGQDLPLGAESRECESGTHTPADHLDRNLLFILSIGAHRAIDGSHSAFRDLFQDLIGADSSVRSTCGRQSTPGRRAPLPEPSGNWCRPARRMRAASQRTCAAPDPGRRDPGTAGARKAAGPSPIRRRFASGSMAPASYRLAVPHSVIEPALRRSPLAAGSKPKQATSAVIMMGRRRSSEASSVAE